VQPSSPFNVPIAILTNLYILKEDWGVLALVLSVDCHGSAMPVHREAKLILAHSTHTSSFTKNQRSQISKHSNYRKLLIWFPLESYPVICCCRQTGISPGEWYPVQESSLQVSTQPSNLQRMYVVSNSFRQFPDKSASRKMLDLLHCGNLICV